MIMADTEDKVNKAKKLIHNVIETVCFYPSSMLLCTNCSKAASIPEGQNELKRNQLRELAALNGTLRDDENQACQNCMPRYCLCQCSSLTILGGQIGHRKYDCPEQRNTTASIICRECGNAGHIAKDCPERQRGGNWRNDRPGGIPGRDAGRIGGGDAVDREYEVSVSRRSMSNQRLQCQATHARTFWWYTSSKWSSTAYRSRTWWLREWWSRWLRRQRC